MKILQIYKKFCSANDFAHLCNMQNNYGYCELSQDKKTKYLY